MRKMSKENVIQTIIDAEDKGYLLFGDYVVINLGL